MRMCPLCGWPHDDDVPCLEVLEGMAASAARDAEEND